MECVLDLLSLPFTPSLSTGCLQNTLSFWISVLLALFERGCTALLLLDRQLCTEQRKRAALLCLDSELRSDTRCVGGGRRA